MKTTVTVDDEIYEVLYDGFTSLRSFDDLDIEIEEVICVRTSCEVDASVITDNVAAMTFLEKYFRDNYDPSE